MKFYKHRYDYISRSSGLLRSPRNPAFALSESKSTPVALSRKELLGAHKAIIFHLPTAAVFDLRRRAYALVVALDAIDKLGLVANGRVHEGLPRGPDIAQAGVDQAGAGKAPQVVDIVDIANGSDGDGGVDGARHAGHIRDDGDQEGDGGAPVGAGVVAVAAVGAVQGDDVDVVLLDEPEVAGHDGGDGGEEDCKGGHEAQQRSGGVDDLPGDHDPAADDGGDDGAAADVDVFGEEGGLRGLYQRCSNSSRCL